jgi:hypothetical protein
MTINRLNGCFVPFYTMVVNPSPLSPVMANLFMEEFEKSYCNVETWFLVQIRG